MKKFLDSNGLKHFCKKLQDYPDNEILETVINAIDNIKVDKIEGKDLSTNDYTNEDKNKLDSSVTFNEQNLSDEQQAQARTNIGAADSKTVEQNKREIFGMGEGILSHIYRVTFNAVWNSKKNQASESASLAEISFYDTNGEAYTIESIKADSVYGAEYAADKVIDGDLTTLWSSANNASVQHWLEITFPSAVSPAQIGVCLRADYNYGLIDEMTVTALAEDGTWFEAAHITGAKDGWNGQTERRFDLKYRLPSLEEKYGKTVSIAADALARVTQTGTRIVIPDAIAGYAMRCTCDSPVTVRSLNRVVLGDVSFTGAYKLVKFKEEIPAGTYRFSARAESTDTDSTQSFIAIGGNNLWIDHDGLRHSVKFTLKESCNSMYLYSSNNAVNGVGDTAYWYDIMIVDGTIDMPYEPGEETVVYEKPEQVVLYGITNIVSADTEISITYARRNEWLNAVLSATKSAELNAQTLGYVTPEMFGAVGDGVTDDLVAIQAAIISAQELNLPMRATHSYLVSDSISIDSKMDVYIHSLKYTRTETAVIMDCQQSRVDIRYLTSGGVGVTIRGETKRAIGNELSLGFLDCNSHCILLEAPVKDVTANRITFLQLKAGGDGCKCILSDRSGESFVAENTYTGGHCMNADWAFYGPGNNSKFYNFQVETNIKGGFCFVQNMNALICGDRHAESMRDGEYPFIKAFSESIPTTSSAGASGALTYISAIGMKVNEIDVSELSPQAVNPSGYVSYAMSSQALGHIFCRIDGYGVTGENGYTIYQHFADGALIWRNCLIFQNVPEKYYTVSENLDLRTIGPDTPALPTIFEIGCANCEIKLHPSYCFMGIRKFEVIQTAEHRATIYDYFTNSVVFDGTSLGAGTYEVSTHLANNVARINGEGMAWRVRKIPDSDAHVDGKKVIL